MVDRLTPERRSWNMSRIRSKDTKPEIIVRSLLHRMGFRFRINPKKLPGRPDIVLPKYRAAVFVHGCFWHRHEGCRFAYTPKSRSEFWQAKFEANKRRDKDARERLREMGWRVVVLWECDINADPVAAVQKLAVLLSPQDSAYQYPMPGRRELLKVAEDRLQRTLGGQRGKQA